MNTDVMLWYLKEVVHKHTKNSPCALIMDNYAVHVTDEARQLAERLHIRLIEMPPNMTKYLQPLDVGVFGPLQKMMNGRWKKSDDTLHAFIQCLLVCQERLFAVPLSKQLQV